jgi:phosphoglycolate phosphatase
MRSGASRQRTFELLVFDWDGTLVDSAQAIVESLQAACRDLSILPPSDRRARHIIGLGLAEALRYAVPDLHPSQYRRLVDRYRIHYLQRGDRVVPFDGVLEGIAELQASGFQLAIATGKSRRGLERALDETGLRRFFVASRCADEGFSKPHPGMLHGIIDELGASSDATLMIGDTTHDVQMAANAGVRALAVTYGAHPAAELRAASPYACVDTPMKLFEWFSSNA